MPQKRVPLEPISIPMNPWGAVTKDAFGPSAVEKTEIGSPLNASVTSFIQLASAGSSEGGGRGMRLGLIDMDQNFDASFSVTEK